MKILLLSLAITLILAANVSAATVDGISSLTVGGVYGGFTDSGYIFSIDAPIQVTGLGFYDNYVNGDKPTVNLYSVSSNPGTLLASLTNTSGSGVGSSDTSDNTITYGSLATPVILSAGTYEVVSSLYYTSNNDTVTFDPAITLLNYVDSNGSNGFSDTSYTTTTAPEGAEANADIQFAPVSTPEPSTWALMIGGLAFLVFFQRRAAGKNA